MRQIQPGTQRLLASALSVQTEDTFVRHIPTGKYGHKDRHRDVLIICDTQEGMEGLTVLPEVLTVTSLQEIMVQVLCLNPPLFIPRGTVIAQAYLLLDLTTTPADPLVMWAQILGHDRTVIECALSQKGKTIHLSGLLETEADVAIISHSEWPRDWPLVPAAGIISGIGGTMTSFRSQNIICFEGPEGRVATVRPFITRAPVTLWGRDLLSQWGIRLEILTRAQDF